MNLLDRHIFVSVITTCAAAVGLFAFVVALPNVVRELLGPLLSGTISIGGFLRLIWLIFVFAVSYALPMGVLTGVLLTLGRLSADSEITAMRAAGLSVTRIARPVVLLGLAGAAAVNLGLRGSGVDAGRNPCVWGWQLAQIPGASAAAALTTQSSASAMLKPGLPPISEAE